MANSRFGLLLTRVSRFGFTCHRTSLSATPIGRRMRSRSTSRRSRSKA